MEVDFGAVFCWKNVIYLVIHLLSLYLWVHYVKLRKDEKHELQKMRMFLDYIDIVSYQYTICNCVEEAVLESLEQTDELLRDTMEEVYRLLLLDDMEELRRYRRKFHSVYYYQFLIYSYLTMEYGDSNEDSLYLDNLLFLKKQVFEWVLDREQLMYELQGLIFLILVPMQFLEAIEVWADYNLADLERYYEYGYGIVVRFFLVLLMMFCYQVMLVLRGRYETVFYESAFFKRISGMRWIEKYYDCWAEHHPRRVKKLTNMLRTCSSRLGLQEFCLLRDAMAVLTGGFAAIFYIPFLSTMGQGGGIGCIILLLTAIIAYNVPAWYLLVRLALMSREKEDEVYFFYAITYMSAYVEIGDVDDILEWLDIAAVIFEPTLQSCMDEYRNDNQAALERAKEQEPFAPFAKLADAFLISEQIGLEQAVYPLHLGLEHFVEKRKQDNRIITENKGAAGRFLAFIPMVCTIAFYLIIPFVLESMVQLNEYIKQMQTGL